MLYGSAVKRSLGDISAVQGFKITHIWHWGVVKADWNYAWTLSAVTWFSGGFSFSVGRWNTFSDEPMCIHTHTHAVLNVYWLKAWWKLKIVQRQRKVVSWNKVSWGLKTLLSYFKGLVDGVFFYPYDTENIQNITTQSLILIFKGCTGLK